jgi:hypothetical protein
VSYIYIYIERKKILASIVIRTNVRYDHGLDGLTWELKNQLDFLFFVFSENLDIMLFW